MTLSISGHSEQVDTQHNNALHYVCYYAECRVFYCYAECYNAQCCYAEYRYDESRYAECRDALAIGERKWRKEIKSNDK